MRIRRRLVIIFATGVLALFAATPPAGAAADLTPRSMASAALSVQPDAPRASVPLQLEVQVTYKGFNGDPDLVIQAAEGQEVEITFVWADTSLPDNSHRVYIKGYDLKTGLLTASNTTETLTFVANQVGDFDIVCDWQCFGHDVLAARLGVGSGAGAATSRPTHMTLSMGGSDGHGPHSRGDSAEHMLTVTLLDRTGTPVANAPVSFTVAAELAGVNGFLEIGRALTDDRGVAAVRYEGVIEGPARVRARFDGVGVYEGATTEIATELTATRSVFGPEETPLRSLTLWLRAGFFLLVVGIWLTLGFVLSQILRIGHVPMAAQPQKETLP